MPTGSVTPAGAAFNGGTITQPLVIAPTDNTVADLLRVVAPAGYEANSAGGVGRMVSVECQDGTRALMLDTYGDGTFMAPAGQGNFSLRVQDVTNTNRLGSISSTGNLNGSANNAAIVLSSESATLFTADPNGSHILTAPANPATQAFVSGAGAQIDTAHDVRTFTPVTFNPTAGAAATCAVAVGYPPTPTYVTLWTETEPAGVALDGTIHGIRVYLPGGWYLKLTVVNATLGTTTYY